MKVLVSAYACDPLAGSEPGVGWAWVGQLVGFSEVTVITRANNRAAIEAAAGELGWVSRVGWVYHDLPSWALALKRLTGRPQWYYVLWQHSASRLISKMSASGEFDYVHHLTFGSYWMPYLTRRVHVPVIVGPMGGAERAPLRFALDGMRPFLFEVARDLARRFGETLPTVRRPARRARVCVAKSPETASRLRALGAQCVIIRSEVAVPVRVVDRELLAAESSDVLRIVSAGRLLHWKGYQLSLRALAAVRTIMPPFSYVIMGEGPYRKRLERLTKRLGLADVTSFVGNQPREAVIKCLSTADVFIHPSLHDSGGWACVEAMTQGLPVICLDIGGPSTQVTSETGVKVAADTPRQCANDLGAAILALARDPGVRRAMGARAQERVLENYSDAALRKWLRELYDGLQERPIQQ